MNASQSWRLLRDGAAPGARNMAVDEALLESAAHGMTPTLRFYSWQPHCLSLGRLQKVLPDAVARAFAQGESDFDIVRRPTGGRAVWHAHEITYSLALSLDQLPADARSVSGAYAWLSAGFARGLSALGVPIEAAPGGVRAQGPNCFAASAGCDFLIEGRKLIGAAQCRRDDALLQHGSILLSIDRQMWQTYAGGPMDSAISLGELGLKVEGEAAIERIIGQLCVGLAEQIGADLKRGGLSETEAERARVLQREKYQSARWNREGAG